MTDTSSIQPPAHSEMLRQCLLAAAGEGASDVHIVAGYPPIQRLHGSLRQSNEPAWTAEVIRDALTPHCPADRWSQFLAAKNIDFALQLEDQGRSRRFRANYFLSGQTMGACFRVIPQDIPDFTWAGFPRDVAERLAGFRNGLVLLTGVTGAGKSTSLAMIINLLNQEGGHRILTVEEPIEYIFPKTARSVVTQREVGRDVTSFADGLKFGLRQDPDVILVGEIRDRETGQMALSAAETGHLVFSTMHTRDAKGAISRFADLFPQQVQNEIRSLLSLSLRAVISQHLLPSMNAEGKRELALEIMFNNAAVATAVRTGRIETIDNCIVTGRGDGMTTLDEAVKRLFQQGRISQGTAERFVSEKALLWR
jgi:twitching motility protein PilT